MLTSLPEVHANSAYIQMLIGRVLFDSMMYPEVRMDEDDSVILNQYYYYYFYFVIILLSIEK